MSFVETSEVSWKFSSGRVDRHERSVFRRPPVADHGIDISRPVRGINGYQAQAQREKLAQQRRQEAIIERIKQVAEEAAGRPLPEFRHDKPSIKVIQAHVCDFAGVQLIDVLSDRRTIDIIKPRHIGMMLSKMLTLRSLPEIGRKFGNRDHTTVLHAIRKTDELQKYVRSIVRCDDEISLWVSTAFKGWDELGLK